MTLTRATRSWRLASILIGTLTLAGCIDSAEPILTDAKPVFGTHIKMQLYSLKDGRADEPEQDAFTWDGQRYVSSNAKPVIEPFTAFPFGDGDFIVQAVSSKEQKTEYALLHKLADGVFLGRVITEDDADEATRKKECTMTTKYTCRIMNREQLLAFAKASVSKNHQSGGLVIMLADTKSR